MHVKGLLMHYEICPKCEGEGIIFITRRLEYEVENDIMDCLMCEGKGIATTEDYFAYFEYSIEDEEVFNNKIHYMRY